MSTFLKSTKGRILLACIALAIVLAVVLVIVLSPKNAYRSIVIAELDGEATVSNDKKQDTPAYLGMALFDGDSITVAEGGRLVIELDGDKFMMAESGTEFRLEATGKAGSDRTVIHLENGSALTRIKNKLGTDQSYVVKTPSSTISVRGTVYYVTVGEDSEGKSVTRCDAFDGVVEVTPIEREGAPTEEPQNISAGFSASVIETEDEGVSSSAFVRDEDGNATQDIDYNDVPKDVIEALVGYIDDGEELDAERDQLEQYIAHEHTYASDWSANDELHWHAVTCEHHDLPTEIRGNAARHTFDEGAVTKEPTEKAMGIKTFTCTVCGYAKTEEIPAVPHTHVWGEWGADVTAALVHIRACTCGETERGEHTFAEGVVTKEPTETETGKMTFTCTVCGFTKAAGIPMLLHTHTFATE